MHNKIELKTVSKHKNNKKNMQKSTKIPYVERNLIGKYCMKKIKIKIMHFSVN